MANETSSSTRATEGSANDNNNEDQRNLVNDAGSKQSTSSKTVTTTTTTTHYTVSQASKAAAAAPPDQSEPAQLETAIVEDLGRTAAMDSSAADIAAIQRQNSTSRNRDQQQQQQSHTQPIGVNSIKGTERDETVDGNRAVTTIATVAAQSGQSRIVLALLKDGDSLQLKVQEMRPGIFDVGANYSEAVKYYEEHRKLVNNLRKQKQTPIEGWLDKYQKVSAAEPNMSTERKLVYMCMVENLQGCWKGLLNQLDKRLQLLDETCEFYESTDQLVKALDRADHHVQVFRQEFLTGPNSIKFHQACNELQSLNQTVVSKYNVARRNQQQLVDLISVIGSGNLGDARVNHLISDAQNLITYISTYIDPLERRKIQLESVITTTKSTTEVTTKQNSNRNNRPLQSVSSSSMRDHQTVDHHQKVTANGNTTMTTNVVIREISNFNDLNLVDNWLQLKIDQLNSSLLCSLGVSVPDSRSILNKHEQIALECRAIEEATLTFNGKSIHAIKSFDKQQQQQNDDKSLFEQQKLLAIKARDVITILEARIVLLRRTIDFYLNSKEATTDIGKMMRRLQVDNSLQSVQFVSNELELKDVSSVVASGATIISELQQLQLAQQHGQRSRIVSLNLVTNGIRAIIDQLNQDLAHLKTVLNQRRLVLLNEDATKMANNFSNKCQQLHFWLNNHAKSYLLANNRLGTEPSEVRAICEGHEQLRVALQNKTLEVEALLRSLPTLTENFDAKSRTSDDIKRATDELRHDWIQVTNCLDRRIELARKYLNILIAGTILSKELDSLDNFSQGRPSVPEKTEEDMRSNVEQSFVQLSTQVNSFSLDAEKINTELVCTNSSLSDHNGKVKPLLVNDLNKQELIDHSNSQLSQFTDRRKTVTELLDGKRVAAANSRKPDPAHQRPQQLDPPRFTRILSDRLVEPFSTVELECEIDQPNCQVEWFMNNYKRIPPAIKHSITSENNLNRLTINNFSPICCGTYLVRASNSAGQAVSQCKLRLIGIKESNNNDDNGISGESILPVYGNDAKDQLITRTQLSQQNFQPSSSPAAISSSSSSFSQWRPTTTAGSSVQTNNQQSSKTIDRIIRGVDSSCEPESPSQRSHTVKITQLTTSDSDTDTTTTTRDNKTLQFPVTQATYSGPQTTTTTTGSSHLRVNYGQVESPISSATLSRSVSKSPFEGTPQPPVFVQGLTDTMSRCCSRAGLVCLVVGNPPPTIEWLHNNRTIATSKCPRTNTCPRGSLCKLTIETMNPQTQGHYVCRASNRIGQTTTGITVAK